MFVWTKPCAAQYVILCCPAPTGQQGRGMIWVSWRTGHRNNQPERRNSTMEYNTQTTDDAACKLTDAELDAISGGDKAKAVAQAKADADAMIAILHKYGVI
jgi:hypothetical protein